MMSSIVEAGLQPHQRIVGHKSAGGQRLGLGEEAHSVYWMLHGLKDLGQRGIRAELDVNVEAEGKVIGIFSGTTYEQRTYPSSWSSLAANPAAATASVAGNIRGIRPFSNLGRTLMLSCGVADKINGLDMT